MSYKHKPDSGTLFINDRKEQPTHSDWTGSGVTVCPHCNRETERWLNEWNVTTDRDGNPLPKEKYRKNLTFKPKQQIRREPQQPSNPEPFDDDIPF
jgi:hypothetical protein